MNRSLITRHAALRNASPWLVIMLVGTQLVTGLYGFIVARTGTMDYTGFLVGGWILLAIYLAWGQVRQRGTRFDLALPIPAHDLWTASFLASTLAVVLMLVVILVVVGGIFTLAEAMVPFDTLRPGGMGRVGSILLAATLCGVAWIHGRHPHLAVVPRNWRHQGVTFGGLLLLLVPMILLQARPLLLVPLLLVAAAMLTARARRQIPAGYVLSPLTVTGDAADTSSSGNPAVAARPAHGVRAAWLVYQMVVRSAPKGPVLWILATPFLLLFGALLSGLLQGLAPDSDLRFAYLPMTAYMVVAFVAPALANLRVVDALPLSRRRLLLLITLPPLVVVTAGYLGGALWYQTLDVEPASIIYVEDDDSFGVRVPRHLWRVAWSGEAPDTVAPWGESRAAMTIPIIRGAAPVLYKPYTTPAGSSQEFVAWQIARAARLLHGSATTTEELVDRQLWTDENGVVRLHNGRLELPAPPTVDAPQAGGRHLPIVLALVAALLYLGIAVYAPAVRAGVSRVRRNIRLWSALGVLLLLHLAPYILGLTGVARLWVLEAAVADGLTRIDRALAAGGIGVWIAALLVGVAAFEIAVRAFQKTESPATADACMWRTLDRAE